MVDTSNVGACRKAVFSPRPLLLALRLPDDGAAHSAGHAAPDAALHDSARGLLRHPVRRKIAHRCMGAGRRRPLLADQPALGFGESAPEADLDVLPLLAELCHLHRRAHRTSRIRPLREKHQLNNA
jgi:hypothetical protein